MRSALAMIAAVAMLTGCGSPSVDSVGRSEVYTWESPGDYRYDLKSSCGEQALIGEFRITVEDSEVADVKGLDEASERLLGSQFADVIPTIEELLEMAHQAERDDAEMLNIEYDSEGVPSLIEFDYSWDAIDDESCFVITNFKPSNGS